jgi:hypothetical protein
MTNRRIADRHPFGDFVTAIFDDRAALCLGTDISERGMFVRSTRAVDAELGRWDGPVIIRFELPGDTRPLWACGRPRRTGPGADGPGTGIEFIYVPDDTLACLRRHLAAAA